MFELAREPSEDVDGFAVGGGHDGRASSAANLVAGRQLLPFCEGSCMKSL